VRVSSYRVSSYRVSNYRVSNYRVSNYRSGCRVQPPDHNAGVEGSSPSLSTIESTQ
jgi:hypothetical protein